MINSSFQFDEGINSTHNNQQQKQNSQRFVKQLSFYSQSSTQTQKLNNSKEENNKKSQLQRQNTIQRVPIYHKNENQQFDLQTFCQQQKLQFQEQYLKNKTLDSSTSSLHNFFSTEEAIQMLEQPLDERRIKGLRQLRVYFQEYEFFQKLLVKEGQEFVNQCVDNLICKSFKCNNLMYNSSLGEIEPDVRGVMILIRGKSRVFYDRECALKYMLGQQCDYQSKSELVFEGFTLGGYEYEQDSVRQNQKKVYSIYCEENCQFAFLDKQSFSQIKCKLLVKPKLFYNQK